MKASTYRKKITQVMKDLGTYKPAFDSTIQRLASLQEAYDISENLFRTVGRGAPVIPHTNKGGNTNLVKNPYLAIMEKQEEQILKYYSELGLTPRGLLRLDSKALQQVKRSKLEMFLDGSDQK